MISVSLAACAGSHDAALGEGYVLGVTVVGNGHNTILLPFQGNYRRSKPYRTSKTPNLSELKFCRWNRSKQKVSRRNQQLYRSRMIYLQVMLSSHRKVRTLPSSCEEKQQKTKKCNWNQFGKWWYESWLTIWRDVGIGINPQRTIPYLKSLHFVSRWTYHSGAFPKSTEISSMDCPEKVFDCMLTSKEELFANRFSKSIKAITRCPDRNLKFNWCDWMPYMGIRALAERVQSPTLEDQIWILTEVTVTKMDFGGGASSSNNWRTIRVIHS